MCACLMGVYMHAWFPLGFLSWSSGASCWCYTDWLVKPCAVPVSVARFDLVGGCIYLHIDSVGSATVVPVCGGEGGSTGWLCRLFVRV